VSFGRGLPRYRQPCYQSCESRKQSADVEVPLRMFDPQGSGNDEAAEESKTVESRVDTDDHSLSSSRNVKSAKYCEGGWHEGCKCQALHCSGAVQQRG